MPVTYDAVSESHGDAAGSASQASFSWTHTTAASPKGVIVFTFVNANADDATSVTYGGVSLTAVSGGRANSANATNPGDCKAWFLGSGVPSGNQTVVVNRNNNANVMFAVAITFNATGNTSTAGVVLLTADSTTLSQQSVNGGTADSSLRVAAINTGFPEWNQAVKVLSNNVTAGANSIWINGDANFVGWTGRIGINDYGNRGVGVVRETSNGTGSRLVGFAGTSTQTPTAAVAVAAVYLAVTEAGSAAPPTQYFNSQLVGVPLRQIGVDAANFEIHRGGILNPFIR